MVRFYNDSNETIWEVTPTSSQRLTTFLGGVSRSCMRFSFSEVTVPDIQTYFVNDAKYGNVTVITDPETLEQTEQYESYDSFCVAGEIVDYRNGTVTVTMGQKTELELLQDSIGTSNAVTNILLGAAEGEDIVISSEKATKIRTTIEQLIRGTVQTTAEAVATFYFQPEWSPDGVSYTAYVSFCIFNDNLYQCHTSHVSQASWPPDTSNLFNLILIDPVTGYMIYQPATGAHDTVAKGVRVVFEGHVHESNIDNNAYSPAVRPQDWTLIE